MVIGASNQVAYVPYSMDNIKIGYGLPPNFIAGFQYVFARHLTAQEKLHMCLTGNGIFTKNLNNSGIIEFAVLQDTLSTATIALLHMTGVAWPMFFTDISTLGTTSVFADKVRRIGTPEKRKAKYPGFDIFTFGAPRLKISEGTRQLA
jgi:hypothetical protein